MSKDRLTSLLDAIISDAKTAILATVDEQGVPRVRWITPALLPPYPNSLFIITAGHFAKVAQAMENPRSSIMLQTRTLDKVVTCEGTLTVLENPSLRTELLETIGRRLHAFWKAGPDDRELVALEFAITEAVYYLPGKGTKEVLLSRGGA